MKNGAPRRGERSSQPHFFVSVPVRRRFSLISPQLSRIAVYDRLRPIDFPPLPLPPRLRRILDYASAPFHAAKSPR